MRTPPRSCLRVRQAGRGSEEEERGFLTRTAINASFRSCFLLACCFSLQQACLRAGLPACRALVVMGWAVGMGSPMHACMCSPSVLACMARLPPAPPLCLNDWFPDPRSAGRAVAWPSRPRRPLGVCETQNSKERPKAGAPMCTGAQAKHSAHHKTPGGGAQGGSKPTSHSAAKGGQLALTSPPPPPPGHIGTLAHWHIGTKACSRAGLFCQFRLARSSRRPQAQAGRQAANKQTNTPLIGQCGVSKARSAKLKKPKERPTACQHYGQVRSLAVRSQIDRQTQVLASQPASQPASQTASGSWLANGSRRRRSRCRTACRSSRPPCAGWVRHSV